jgi:hydroxypyruvate reductase
MDLRSTARRLFQETLGHLSIFDIVKARVQCVGQTLRVGSLFYDLRGMHRIVIISVGKAAAPMCDGLLATLQPALQANQSIEAIVVGSTPPRSIDSRIRLFPGSHPFPSELSYAAADVILELLESVDERCFVFFLISGGASAMIESPLDNSISIAEATEFYRTLVQSGLPITTINVLRKHFSRVKGGRLAVASMPATQCTVLLSDVPENLLHIIGSGPSLPDPSTVEDCRQIITDNRSILNISEKMLTFFQSPALEETPKGDHPAFKKSNSLVLLSSIDLHRTAAELATRLGFHVVVDNNCDDWDYRDAAHYLLSRLRELQRHHRKVCLLSTGEVSVHLPVSHGIGGRNQQFALYSSLLITRAGMLATVLSAGSDGVDGNSPAAGAISDETTMERAAALGLDSAAELERFNSFAVFHAVGDTVITGPSGNNIRDLRMLLSEA